MKKYIKSGVSVLGFVGLVFCISLFVVLPVYADSAGIKDIVTGGTFSVMLKDDGSVWAWGYNAHGALGDGTSNNECRPIQVPISDVNYISVGIDHVMALKNDGTVWVWGSNLYGQFGNGTISSVPEGQTLINLSVSSLPEKVPSLINVKAISAGADYCLVLKDDGTVWAWGDNRLGTLGDGTTTTSGSPVQVKGLTNIVAISGGTHHALALDNRGNVWAWGNDNDGELGNSSGDQETSFGYKYNPLPVKVPIDNVANISAGTFDSMAIKKDGTLWAWGYNENGELGDGTSDSKSTPTHISGLNNVVEMCSPGFTAMALTSDGTLWTWGVNNGLSTSTVVDSGDYHNAFYTPIKVAVINNIKKFSFKVDTILALKNDDTLWAWGSNQYGGLGIGIYDNESTQDPFDLSANIPKKVLTNPSDIPTSDQILPTVTITQMPLLDNNTLIPSSVSQYKNTMSNNTSPNDNKRVLIGTLQNYKLFGFIGLILVFGIIGYLWKKRYN